VKILKQTRNIFSIGSMFILMQLTAFISVNCYAQEPGFSQFYANELYLNPALAGNNQCPKASLAYRNQWPGLQKAFTTYSAGFDSGLSGGKSNIGLLLLRDDQGNGTITAMNISGIYAYNVSISRKSSLRFGLKLSVIQQKVDYSGLVFSDQMEGSGTQVSGEGLTGSASQTDFDGGVGFVFTAKQFFVGAAADHIYQGTRPLADGFVNFPMKYTVHAGTVIEVGKQLIKGGFKVSPNILYLRQNNFEQINCGTYLTYNILTTGLWLRNDLSMNLDAAIMMIGLTMERFSIGYSYDFTLSELFSKGNGAHEISFHFKFDCPQKHKKMRAVSCPEF
jgi:type IX secretion system PorP/SprF family membrane protein